MNIKEFNSDKVEDIKELIQKIGPLLDEYGFSFEDTIALFFSILQMEAEIRIEEGADVESICYKFKEAHEMLLHQIRAFKETEKK